MMRAFLVAGMLLSAGCHPNRPVIDPGPRPDVDGTISGVAADEKMPLPFRKITAVNIETGAKFETSSASAGGYTVRVPPGTYRLEIDLLAGEKLAVSPEPTEVEPGDLDAGRNFVVIAVADR